MGTRNDEGGQPLRGCLRSLRRKRNALAAQTSGLFYRLRCAPEAHSELAIRLPAGLIATGATRVSVPCVGLIGQSADYLGAAIVIEILVG